MPSEVANDIQTVLRNIISPSATSMMKELFYVALAIFLATKHGRLSPLYFRFEGGGGWGGGLQFSGTYSTTDVIREIFFSVSLKTKISRFQILIQAVVITFKKQSQHII